MILIVLLQVNRSQARNFVLCTAMVIRPITFLKYCHLISQNRLSIYSMKVIVQKWVKFIHMQYFDSSHRINCNRDEDLSSVVSIPDGKSNIMIT